MATVEESVQTLEALCQCAVSLSLRTQGRPTYDWQLLEGSTIFARNCLTCISLLRLVPISSFYRPVEKLDAWDLASVASLVRNIIETYFVLFYVLEQVSESENRARQCLWRFHESSERLKALRLGVPSSKRIAELEKEYFHRKQQLESSSFFQTLPTKQRKNLLDGRDSKFLTRGKLAELARSHVFSNAPKNPHERTKSVDKGSHRFLECKIGPIRKGMGFEPRRLRGFCNSKTIR
jgi:hypothetical protein